MAKKNVFYVSLMSLLTVLCPSLSSAAASCEEVITSLVMHSNGQVYFKTDKTCTVDWCHLNWGDTDRINRGYAMLLAARSTERPVSFYWAGLSNCSSTNPAYASPDYFYF